jgi:hypothetical protein
MVERFPAKWNRLGVKDFRAKDFGLKTLYGRALARSFDSLPFAGSLSDGIKITVRQSAHSNMSSEVLRRSRLPLAIHTPQNGQVR